MADNDLYDLISQADPSVLQLLIDAGLVPSRMGIEGEKMSMGQGMMNTPTPQGRDVGHTYVASSPLEHLSAAIRQGVGAKMAGGAMQGQQDLTGQQGAGRLAYLRLLAGQGGAGQPGAQQPEFVPTSDVPGLY